MICIFVHSIGTQVSPRIRERESFIHRLETSRRNILLPKTINQWNKTRGFLFFFFFFDHEVLLPISFEEREGERRRFHLASLLVPIIRHLLHFQNTCLPRVFIRVNQHFLVGYRCIAGKEK